jgi:hypothetical protein
MELTRRDAAAALAAAGVAVGGGAAALYWDDLNEEGFGERERETLLALAEVVYPTEVEGVPAFVERYVVGRVEDRPERAAGMRAALSTLDEYADQWFDRRYAALPEADRDAVLDRMAVDVADPDPEGLDGGRVRYYLVDELLYALYTSPTGGELVGIENPAGYPGGTTSYQRGPEAIGGNGGVPDDRASSPDGDAAAGTDGGGDGG